jgi:hypothetical protein
MSTSNEDSYNLDITDIETDAHDQLSNVIERFYKADSQLKTQLAYHWERNHLMLDGRQWLTYDRQSGTGRMFTELRVSRANEFIPRPVTNYMYDVYQTLKSYLQQHNPRSSIRPNTQNYDDKMAAKIGELIAEANWERLKETQNYGHAAACALTYGTVFKKDYWDTTALITAQVPRIEEQPIPDPMTGAPTSQMQPKEVVDPTTGEPVMDEIPVGDINTEVVEPYRIALDPLASDLHNARWIMEYSIQPLNWIQETYGRDEPGYTGRAQEVKEERNLSNSMRRFYELKTSSGVKYFNQGFPGFASTSSSDQMIKNAAVVKEYYEKPSQKHPKGRLVVVANGITLYAGDSPCEGPDLDSWHPFSEFRWEIVPGRFWGKGPFNDACELQKRLNSIDATIVLTRKTMAIPQKLMPKGAGVKRGEWTGRPGQQIDYRPVDGAKPETVPPVGVDAQVFQERMQVVQDIKQVTGAVDIMKGERPPSVSAASALEMLYEVATGKLRPSLDRWKTFIETSQKKQLRLTAQRYREPREQFIRLMKSRNSSLSENTLDSFIGSDLRDNCNIIVEAGSNIPKLLSARKAQLQQLAQVGVLQLEVPENRIKFLEEMGIQGYDQNVSPDVKRAEYENDIMRQIEQKPDQRPLVMDIDEHEIHVEIHKRFMKEPAFLEVSQTVQQQFMVHLDEHQRKIEEAEALAQQKAMAMGQSPMPPQMEDEKQPLQGSGKGVPTRVGEQLLGSDLPKRG